MKIYFDFPLILTGLVFLTGFITLIDVLFFSKKRERMRKEEPWFIDYPKSFFPVLLIILLIRSFLIQPYRVPSGSLEPTVLPGDFIAVNQFAYGLRLPVLNKKIYAIGEPKLGDIALFRWPIDPSIIFVKRVIGVPGDHIIYKDKKLTINGKLAEQQFLGQDTDKETFVPVKKLSENLPNDIKHNIFIRANTNNGQNFEVTVPKDSYFMMGDNRDGSDDSRYWGFVPEANLVGKAFVIWMSWDKNAKLVRFNRLGTVLK